MRALERLRDEGAALATLGTAPLAKEGDDVVSTGDHPVIERALRRLSVPFSVFYNFDGIRKFKNKFVPSWWKVSMCWCNTE